MTSSGRRIAFVLGVLLALALPRRIDHPSGVCPSYEVVPLGIYLIRWISGSDFGFAYSSGRDLQRSDSCR